jgi:hypothetical protein
VLLLHGREGRTQELQWQVEGHSRAC